MEFQIDNDAAIAIGWGADRLERLVVPPEEISPGRSSTDNMVHERQEVSLHDGVHPCWTIQAGATCPPAAATVVEHGMACTLQRNGHLVPFGTFEN